MDVSYYRISFPGYYPKNDYDCPIEYFIKKYSMGSCLPLPRSKKYINGEYIAALPSTMSDSLVDILINEEDCKVSFIKKEIYNKKGFENTYVFEVYEKIGGINTVNLSIFTRQ